MWSTDIETRHRQRQTLITICPEYRARFVALWEQLKELLAAFLAENLDVTVYLPQSFPANIKDTVRQAGATLVEVTGPQEIVTKAHTTGELGSPIREQALALETARGLVVITGCAHPGIATMVREAKAQLGGDVYLALGGFHLGGASATQIVATIAELQELGVQRSAPSHCTGDAARRAFAEAFGAVSIRYVGHLPGSCATGVGTGRFAGLLRQRAASGLRGIDPAAWIGRRLSRDYLIGSNTRREG